ncbi:MAG TPA: ImcF-related family protein, partial [Burkholderiaceae bacterium]|nr:ImcF-related family protein [Burkholderiaceae bacterium]
LAHRVLPPGRPSGRSYFVTRLLREVVLGEAGLAGTNRRWERQRAWLHGGVVVASALLTVLALAWGWRQYASSAQQLAAAAPAVARLQTQAAAAKAQASDLATLVPLLDGLWSLAGDSDAHAARRAAAIGLDQGGNLGAGAQDAYHPVRRDAMVPHLAKRLEQRLDATGADALFARYEALKSYLMLFGGTHFDATALRNYLVADWEQSAAQVGSAAARKALREHLDRLLATGEVGAPSMADTTLVTRARQQLSNAAPAQRVLARLRQGDAAQGATVLSIDAAALPGAQKVLTRASGVPLESGVSPLYTRAAQAGLRTRVQDSVRQLDEEAPWVLGTPSGNVDAAARARLVDAIASQLAVERLRAWDALVFDLRLLPVSSLAAAAEQARAMSRPDSPLNAWLAALLRDMGPTVSAPDSSEALSAEADRLNALRAYTLGTPAGYEVVHAAVGRIATQLAAIDDAAARKTQPPAADAWQELASATARTPEPLRTLWQQLGETDAALAFGTLRELWGHQLAGEVVPACARALDGRYPFVHGTTQEVLREDFVRMFASGGVLDGFFQRNLAGWVDTSTRPWGVRAVPQGKWGDALLPFQRAQAIRNAFFSDGRQFGVRIDLKLLELDPGIGQLTIDVDGQSVRFARDTRSVQTLVWPGPGGAGRIQLQANAPGASSGARFTFEGPWSLLHLFEPVRVEPAAGGRVVLVFDVEGRRARLEALNPNGLLAIKMPELEQFQCPRRL